MVLSDGKGTPLVAMTESTTHNEAKLLEPMLERLRVPKIGRGRPRTKIGRLIYDKVADSDLLRLRLLSKCTKVYEIDLSASEQSQATAASGWP